MKPELTCARCEQVVAQVVQMENGELWCEPCDEKQPAYPRWERNSEPMDAQTVFRQRLSELRRDLQALQKQLDTSTKEWEVVHAQRALARWLPEHDQMIHMFREQGWRIPNPGWKLKTAADRAGQGEVHVDPYDLDILASALVQQQWALEPVTSGSVTMLLTPALDDQLRATLLSLSQKVRQAGGLPRDRYTTYREHTGPRKALRLEPLERWLLHHLAARQATFLQGMAAEEKTALIKEMLESKVARWSQLRDLTQPPARAFAGARLVRVPTKGEQELRERVERAQELWKMTIADLGNVRSVLGTGAKPAAGDVFGGIPGLIWDIQEYLLMAPGLKPDAREHLESVLVAARGLRQAIDDLERWATDQRPENQPRS